MRQGHAFTLLKSDNVSVTLQLVHNKPQAWQNDKSSLDTNNSHAYSCVLMVKSLSFFLHACVMLQGHWINHPSIHTGPKTSDFHKIIESKLSLSCKICKFPFCSKSFRISKFLHNKKSDLANELFDRFNLIGVNYNLAIQLGKTEIRDLISSFSTYIHLNETHK